MKDTTMSDFNGTGLMSLIDNLADDAVKTRALTDAIQQADAAHDTYWRLVFRFEYAWHMAFHDDPPKAIPIGAEFNAILEQHPDALPPEQKDHMHLVIMQFTVDPIAALPQIPISEWKQLMDKFYALTQHYQIGERLYWWRMADFWQYIDSKQAFEYFKNFWNSKQDKVSDCKACDVSHAIHMSLLIGDRQAADCYAEPLKNGRMTFCSDTPQLMWLAYLEDALRRGDLEEARSFANKLYREGIRDKSDLGYLAAILHCWAYVDLELAIQQIGLRLDWALSMWDQKKKYDFYKASWICFYELSKQQDSISLPFSAAFPLYREDTIYHTDTLAQWFHTEAEKIAARFDARNGTDYFQRNLAQARLAAQN